MAARYGGEEFALILHYTDGPVAFCVAERFRRRVENHEFHEKSETLRVTISAGVATFRNEQIHDSKELIEGADKALYLAKEKGRNRVEMYGIED